MLGAMLIAMLDVILDAMLDVMLDEALSADAKAGLQKYSDAVAKHGEIQQAAGRDVLIFAARFPNRIHPAFMPALTMRRCG